MATVLSPPDQRIVLEDISWAMYEDLLAAHRDRSIPRFTFDRGRLEIMSPSSKHEELNRAAAAFIEIVAETWDVDFVNLGSTTFRREDLERGFEPDSCFYFNSIERIRGKAEIDLSDDPPPDLIIEIDITSPSIKKLPIFAALGVTEVWQYDGRRARILRCEGEDYIEQAESLFLPGVTPSVIERFLDESRRARRPQWMRGVREWAANRPRQ